VVVLLPYNLSVAFLILVSVDHAGFVVRSNFSSDLWVYAIAVTVPFVFRELKELPADVMVNVPVVELATVCVPLILDE
jgi:hypothetical protein